MSKGNLIMKLKQLKCIAEECMTILEEQNDPLKSRGKLPPAGDPSPELDFDKPIRPFMKTHSRNLSGSKKFVLLLAWLAKGDLKKQIALSQIKDHWNKMTAILGMDFNLFFPGDAKDRDWVEAKTKGQYNLRPAWKGILDKEA